MKDILILLLPSKNQNVKFDSKYEPISDMVFTEDQLAYMFKNEMDFYENEWKVKINEWLKKLEALISSVVKNER